MLADLHVIKSSLIYIKISRSCFIFVVFLMLHHALIYGLAYFAGKTYWWICCWFKLWKGNPIWLWAWQWSSHKRYKPHWPPSTTTHHHHHHGYCCNTLTNLCLQDGIRGYWECVLERSVSWRYLRKWVMETEVHHLRSQVIKIISSLVLYFWLLLAIEE